MDKMDEIRFPVTLRYRLLQSLRNLQSPLAARAFSFRNHLADNSNFWESLDRLNVLEGHTGCVNALSWSSNGETLISGGDDRTIRIWRLDESDMITSFPYTTRASICTGHTANIFNAQFLSQGSNLIATCAGDNEVRIFSLDRLASEDRVSRRTPSTTSWNDPKANCLRAFCCHRGRVKRIMTEESDRHFLTVSEDGTVRHHDLRVFHRCDPRNRECPPPLVRVRHELSTIAMSALSPYYFVVAGESPHGYLFDRRSCGRSLLHEWGADSSGSGTMACVRSFGRSQRGPAERHGAEHVTGARMSQTVGHELLLSYSADAVYLYNTHDEPESCPATKDDRTADAVSETHHTSAALLEASSQTPTYPNDTFQSLGEYDEDFHDLLPEANESDSGASYLSEGCHSDHIRGSGGARPVVLPRRRFTGARNVETVKDVSFLGSSEEYVVSGSDDGNFFIWSKETGELVNILEGDGSIVNVVEQNPCFQCLAVSGIDNSIKIFGRSPLPSAFSRLEAREDIIEANTIQSSRILSQRARLLSLLAQYHLTASDDSSGESNAACVYQ